MATIDRFLGGARKSRVTRFAELVASGDCTEEQKRQYEMDLLRPTVLPAYAGASSKHKGVGDRTIQVVFDNDDDLSLFSRYFKVTSYVANSVPDISLLMALLRALETGELKYDEETKSITAA